MTWGPIRTAVTLDGVFLQPVPLTVTDTSQIESKTNGSAALAAVRHSMTEMMLSLYDITG